MPRGPRSEDAVVRPLPEIDTIRRSERMEPLDNRRLRRALDEGTWVKVAPGAFVRSDHWLMLTPIERHRVRVHEVARRLEPGAVISYAAAAAEHGIDMLDPWPAAVDVTCGPATGGRSSGVVRRHTRDRRTLEVMPFGRHMITTPAQTALDLARSLRFLPAVASVDQAIWADRPGGELTDIDTIHELWTRDAHHRGQVRALRVLSFAERGAANVRESHCRVELARLGFPRPRLQERRMLRTGRLVFADFYFPEADHWGEFDGEGKYRDAALRRPGHDAADAVIDEKNRENEIRREVRGFSRWDRTDVERPRRLYDILTGDGLRSALPRP